MGIALGLVALALTGAARATDYEPQLGADGADFRLELEPDGPIPSATWRAAVLAPSSVVSIRYLVGGRPVGRSRRPPFRERIELSEDPVGPTWIEAIGLDAGGLEVARDGRCVHRPADTPALRWVRTSGGSLLAMVEAAQGHRVERVELVTPEGEPLASRVDRPYRFAPSSSGPWGARARFDDGTALEAWLADGEIGESIDVRLGQARWIGPPEAPAPTPEDVRVLYRGEPQKVLRVVGGGAVRLELGFAIDTSESTHTRFNELRSAARALATRLLGPEDRSFVVPFSTRADVAASGRGDLAGLLAALPAESREEATHLYDALAFALLQFHGEDPRAALVVLTDACDTTAKPDLQRVTDLARRRAVPVYGLLLEEPCTRRIREVDVHGPDSSRDLPDERLGRAQRTTLGRVVRSTGGRILLLQEGNGIQAALEEILRELERQWIVVFEPSSDRVSSGAVEVRVNSTMSASN